MVWNYGRTKIVDYEIVYKICFSSAGLRSGISYLIPKEDIAEHRRKSFGIIAVIARVFDKFLKEHTDVEEDVAMQIGKSGKDDLKNIKIYIKDIISNQNSWYILFVIF